MDCDNTSEKTKDDKPMLYNDNTFEFLRVHNHLIKTTVVSTIRCFLPQNIVSDVRSKCQIRLIVLKAVLCIGLQISFLSPTVMFLVKPHHYLVVLTHLQSSFAKPLNPFFH